jgi:hypothetical protein
VTPRFLLHLLRQSIQKRRDAMAMAAAPYLHAKLNAVDASLSPAAPKGGEDRQGVSVKVAFVHPVHNDYE